MGLVKYLIAVLLLIPVLAFADASIDTGSCTREAIQSAITTASSSSGVVTVTIPECSATTHTSAVTINMSSGFASVTSLIIQGSGDRGTNLVNSGWNITMSATKKLRITNLTLSGSTTAARNLATFEIYGTATPSAGGGFRFDNMAITLTTRFFITRGLLYGLVDNISGSVSAQFGNVGAGYVNLNGGGNESWNANDTFGGIDAVYVENCTIEGSTGGTYIYFPVDSDSGARFVHRFNTFTNLHFGGHDASTGGERGQYQWEYYNNTTTRNKTTWANPSFKQRGGAGYAFNNYVDVTHTTTPWACASTGSANSIWLTNHRSNMAGNGAPWLTKCDASSTAKICTTGSLKTCTTDGNCDSGTCDYIDGQVSETGYPCRDQIGRTKDQALKPVVFWNNSQRMGGSTTYASVCNDATTHIQADRDYYISSGAAQTNATSPFNGTTGAGYGTKANRPTTCTTGSEAGGGVAYWATDENKLYRCTSTNTWSEEYTPYTCPHPLADPSAQGVCDFTQYGTVGYTLTGGESDETAPTVTSVYVNGATMTINFSEPITSAADAGFSLTPSGAAVTVDCPEVATGATSMACTISRALVQSETATYAYTDTKVIDAASNALANIGATDITGNLTPAEAPTAKLTVNKTGAGCTVTSSPSGISFGGATASDDFDFNTGTVVTLSGYSENGWNAITYGGDCASNGTVTMNAAKECTATCTQVQLFP